MANNIKLVEKYLPEIVDTVFAQESKTALLENGQKFIDLNFKETGYVKILNIAMDGLSDYYRVNRVGVSGSGAYAHDNQNNGTGYRDGYRRGNVATDWEVFQLQYNRGKQFVVDYLDDEESAGAIIANLLKEFVRTKLVPEIDATRFSKMVGYCNGTLGNLVNETVASLGNAIIGKFNTAFEWLTEHEVPEEEQIIFVSPKVMTLIKGTTELSHYIVQADFVSEKGITFKLPAYEGRPIVVVPSDRFYDKIVVGDNGYAPATGSKIINYIVCSKKAIIPVVKLEKTKVWTPETQDDFDGYKVNVHLYHDCFIPKNKVVGCYCSLSDTTATTKTSKLDIAMVEGTTQNGYVVKEAYTTPAGILGSVVVAQSAFTLGATITVDGTNIKAVNLDEEIIDATNTKAYFALIDGANKVVAISAQLDLVKKA